MIGSNSTTRAREQAGVTGLDRALERPDPSTLAPPGFIVVRAYTRTVSGKSVLVHSYTRRLKGRYRERLLSENLRYLYWNSGKSYPSLKDVADFEGKGAEYDPVIQFWLDYWRSKGIPLPGVDPLPVKVVIALESGFDPNADPHVPTSTALGLMQVTRQALRSLTGEPNSKGYREVRTNRLLLSRDELADEVVNIAAGIRWLGYKMAKIPKGHAKNVRNMLANYHGWGEEGQRYAAKVLRVYERSR